MIKLKVLDPQNFRGSPTGESFGPLIYRQNLKLSTPTIHTQYQAFLGLDIAGSVVTMDTRKNLYKTLQNFESNLTLLNRKFWTKLCKTLGVI